MARAINYKPTREFSISDFGGVDLSSSPVKVSGTRASYMKNFYKDEDVIKKRPGFRQALFNTVEGKIEKIVKMGERVFFFSIKDGTGYAYEATFIDEELTNLTQISRFTAENVEVFYNKERLYILTGEEFLVLYQKGESYVVEKVSDNAYIPTTTAGIADNVSLNESRYTLDAVNMLTPYRKNELTVTDFSYYEKRIFKLDEATVQKTSLGAGENSYLIIYSWGSSKLTEENCYVKISYNELEYVVGLNSSESELVKTSDGNHYFEFKTTDANITLRYYINTGVFKIEVKDSSVSDFFSNEIFTLEFFAIKKRVWKLDSTIDEDEEAEFIAVKKNGREKKLNIIDVMDIEYEDWESDNFISNIDGYYQGNQVNVIDTTDLVKIIVTFKHSSKRDDTDYGELAKGCRFGTVFGTTGSSNRLFISGNPDFPNVEFWSESEDYTYFPDINYNTVGSDLTAIVGYSRLNDEVLAVFKEKSGIEPTVYYKSGKYTESYDEAGNLIYAVTTFPTYAGNVGDTMVSRRASINFLGDPLILSDEGVRGIVLRENVNTAERYTRERSRLIDKELTADRGSLSNAVAAVFDSRCYLSIGDGRVYVADARYKTTLPGDIDGSYNYEWWVWDGIPATAFCEIGGKLYFGTGDGRICVFDGESTDRIYHQTSYGQMTFNIETLECTAYDEELSEVLKEGAKIIVNNTEGYIYDLKGPSFGFKITKYPGGPPYISNIGDRFIGATIEEKRDIAAEWRSAVMSLGTITEAKSLLSMTVSGSLSNSGELMFGYTTKYGKDERELKGTTSLDFDNFDFTRFSFDNDFQSSHTVKLYERNFNYIQLGFVSPRGQATVNELIVTYKINKKIRGVR